MTPPHLPTLVAHRGWPARYPENTLEGFAAAATTGARFLECDVQLTADGVPFICHDLSLKRTAGLDRNITALRAAELSDLNVGEPSRFAGRYPATKIPTLDAVVDWLRDQRQLMLFVEIKRESLRYHGARFTVAAVMRAIEPALEQCVVISFDHGCLSLARQQGATAVGWALEDVNAQARHIAGQLMPDYLFTAVDRFAQIHAALPGTWRWIAYHTEEATRALDLAREGAAFVETNDIGALLADRRFQPRE